MKIDQNGAAERGAGVRQQYKTTLLHFYNNCITSYF